MSGGLSVGALEALADAWSKFLGAIRLTGRVLHPLPGLSSSPHSHPDIVSDVLGRISSVTGFAPGGVWGVVGAREVAAHQSSGNESNVSGIVVFSGVGRRLPCDRDVRQLDGSGLRQLAGQDGLLFPLPVGQPAFEVDGDY